MTSGEPPAGPSAAKLGGFALIGIGGLAAIFGVATFVSGGPQDAAQEPPPGPTSPPFSTAPNPPAPPQDTANQPPPAAQPPAPTGQVEQPPAAQPPQVAPPPGDPAQGTDRVVVRVYNNSTIKGLAQRAADDFRRAGFDVPEVGNYSEGRIYTTTIYFRPGTDEETKAREIAEHFGARLEPRFDGIAGAKPGIIAIITNDYRGAPASK
jgi:hypothetical protein